MKKILIIAVVALYCFGCSKETTPDARLVGTTYRTDAYKSLMGPLYGYQYHLYEFTTSKDGTAYWADKNGKQNGSDGSFTYRLEYPELFITDDKGSEEHFHFKDARSFALVKKDGSINDSFVYYKQ